MKLQLFKSYHFYFGFKKTMNIWFSSKYRSVYKEDNNFITKYGTYRLKKWIFLYLVSSLPLPFLKLFTL